MRRRVLPAIATSVLLGSLALTGCSTAAQGDTCLTPLSPGALSESVSVTGDDAASLRVSVSSSLTAMNPQRSILSSAGDGEVVIEGAIVEANFAYIDGESGEVLEASPGFGSGKGDSLFIADPAAGTVVAGTLCAAVGDTVAIALSQEESMMMGVTGGVIVIAEIEGVSDARATGSSRPLPSGFPAIATREDGQPGVVLPPQAAPSGVRSAANIQGTGAPVTPEANVIGQVLTVSWEGELEQNSWNTGPIGFGTEADMENSGMTFRSELNGFPTGSQVVILEGGESPRVSVVDILAVIEPTG